MPTLSTGRTIRGRRGGITLIEMMIVTLLIALMAGVSFPALSAGIDSIRLASASRSIVGFFNSALQRAGRRQETVEVVVSMKDNRLWMRSTAPGFRRELSLPDGVTIANVFPEIEDPESGARSFLLYPGGATPAMGVTLKSRRGDLRTVRVDPITGVPQVQTPPS